MFRRKEENINDPSSPMGSTPGAQAGSSHEASSSNSAPQPSSSGAGAQSLANTYVPTAPAARTTHEPSRPATPAYRPTPIAEFNRGASRGASEALRSNAASSSFSPSSEKSASAKSNRRVLTVGNDILLKGEIATCDRLVIEGRVEAKLSEVHTVEIAEAGSFKGTAEVEDAEISGVFEGDLIVRNRLVIYASGEVRGNISYGEIEIERGGKLTGQIKTGNAGAKGKAFDAQDKARSKETAAA